MAFTSGAGLVALSVVLLISVSSSSHAQTSAPIPAPEAPGSPPAAPLSLDASVGYALAHNPQMRVAAAEREIALAKLIPQQPKFRPDVTASAYQSFEGPGLNLPLTVGPDEVVIPYQEHHIAFSADQILFHPGKSANGRRLAAETRIAGATYEDAAAVVAHDVMTAFYQVLQAKAGETVAKQAVTDLQASVDRVKILIQAGQAVNLDLLTAESALGQVKQDATTAENGLVVAKANLNRTLGRPLSTPVDLAAPANGPTAPASLKEATRTALLTRPDIQQQQAQVEAAQAALALARGENGPTVTALASYALQTPTALQRSTEWMLRAMVSIPVFQTAAVQSDVQQAAAGLDAATAGLQALQEGDALLVLKAWEDLQTARSAVDTDAAATAEQQEAFRAVGLKQQVGEATEGDAAQARLKLEQAISTQTRDQYAVDLRTVDLRYAMGLLAPQPGSPASVKSGAPGASAARAVGAAAPASPPVPGPASPTSAPAGVGDAP